MDRRTVLLASLAAVAAGGAIAQPATGRRQTNRAAQRPAGAPEPVAAAVRAFAALQPGQDGRASCVILADAQRPGRGVDTAPLWRAAHEPDASLFVGSAVKTLILAAFLRQEEAGKLSSKGAAIIDDTVRSLSSPVFLHLTGRTPYVSVLEAMIAHSDNTATDVALAAATPAAVRQLIKSAGLKRTRIPDSTRALFNWLGGGDAGVDPGWRGLQAMAFNLPGSVARSLPGDGPSMQSTAAELVAWHRAALAGQHFSRPETLVTYKRIMAMADALAVAVPPDMAAWGKGGSIDWQDFHCRAFAGQMLAPSGPVTFSFIQNWRGPQAAVPEASIDFRDAVRHTLAVAAREMGRRG